ncbi:DUF7691 family protein [Myroides odoratimimus]|uniref:DUF7691 family protein n=1 Tax=Myroides odoratimimus TaxID=76832 RepID=UPI00257551D7|nr:hypothetical protein [Myroides odoratimimus]MDM1395704.1 hypothetical protein [Myroides odoratimimus]
MSYSVQSYLTDKTKIQQVYGCKDLTLYNELCEAFQDQLDEHSDYFDNELEPHSITFVDILLDIINGEIQYNELTFAYGYVYELLCEHYGEVFYPTSDEYSTPYYETVETELTSKAFIPIPFSEDFPSIYSIAIEDLDKEVTPFIENYRRKKEIDEETYTLEQEDFLYAFELAKKQNKDLVFFLY